MASVAELAEMAELRATAASLTKNGFHAEAEVVRRRIADLNHPHIGEILFVSPEQQIQVVSVEGTRVGYVKLGTEVRYTHQGNLDDTSGNAIYSTDTFMRFPSNA